MTKNNSKRIVIVDEHPVVRQGLKTMINQEQNLQVCGEFANADQVMKSIDHLQPDMMIVDIDLEGASGLELIKMIRTKNVNLPVLVFSKFDESLYAERVIRAKANGYISIWLFNY